MSRKKIGLLILLALFSIVLGGVLGTFNFYEILTGDRFLNISLFILSLFIAYLASILIFLLGYSDNKNLTKAYMFVSFFFGLTFYFVTTDLIISVINAIVYFLFLYYLYTSTLLRSSLFVKFLPEEIFFPSLKRSFFYLIVLYSLISFMQTHQKVTENSLITPRLVRVVLEPVVSIVDKQLSAQIQSQIPANTPNKEAVIKAALSQMVDSFVDPKTKTVYGIRRADIAVEKAIITQSGEIDFNPVLQPIVPLIANRLNMQLSLYRFFAPLIVIILILFILQPVFFIFQIIESAITIGIFKFLLVINFITIHKEAREVEKITL